MDAVSDKAQWAEHAFFFLFFDYKVDENGRESWQTRIWQTRVYYAKTGEEKIIPDIDPREWVPWIIKQANLPTVLATAPKLSILDVQVEGKVQPKLGNKKLSVEIHFSLSEAYVSFSTAESIPYQIFLFIVDQEHGLTKLIASEHNLFYPDQPLHIHRVEFPVPAVGRYTLQTFVLVQAETELMAVHRGPTINVVP